MHLFIPTHSLPRFRRALKAFAFEDKGAVAIEYAAIGGLMVLFTVTSLALAGLRLTGTLGDITAAMSGPSVQPGTGMAPPQFSSNGPPAYDPGSPVENAPSAGPAPESPVFKIDP